MPDHTADTASETDSFVSHVRKFANPETKPDATIGTPVQLQDAAR